jgi:hypothetical protein
MPVDDRSIGDIFSTLVQVATALGALYGGDPAS